MMRFNLTVSTYFIVKATVQKVHKFEFDVAVSVSDHWIEWSNLLC